MSGDVERDCVRVLLRSLWQTVNIGDVAHAPGTLRAFRRYAPDVELTLWPRQIDSREREMLARFLPEVRIVEGTLDHESGPLTPELRAAFDRADLLLHGPASGLGAEADLAWWARNAGRPYGFFGVSVDPVSHPDFGALPQLAEMITALPDDHIAPGRRELLDGAAFLFCRDSLTLRYLRAQGIKTPVLDFGPDATFVFDLYDHDAADTVLAQHGLSDGEFVCVIPRLRYTPYYKIRGTEPTATDHWRDAENEQYRDGEMTQLRGLVTTIARETGLRVLVCPEMSYEVELAKSEVVDQLPEDVRGSVAWLPYYWGVDEAAAVYTRAHSVVSMECHSPIMSAYASTPTIYVRQPTDTIKGQMWSDVELPGSVVELHDIEPGQLESAWHAIRRDRPGAVEAVRHGSKVAQEHLRRMVKATMAAR